VSNENHHHDQKLLPRVAAELGLQELYAALHRVLEPISPAIEQIRWLFEPMVGDVFAADQSSPPKEGE
jgi:hypothetical protein